MHKCANICGICPMSLPQLHIQQKYAKNMHVYAKYVSMKFICIIICTFHFADVET